MYARDLKAGIAHILTEKLSPHRLKRQALNIFGWAMLAGFTVFVVVSLLTKPESNELISEYFDKMQRLSDAEVSEKDGKKPLAGEFGQELLLLDFPGWFTKKRWQNFSFRYREDWRGFIYACGFVGLLMFIAWAVIQL